jgi:hypothetical protein
LKVINGQMKMNLTISPIPMLKSFFADRGE